MKVLDIREETITPTNEEISGHKWIEENLSEDNLPFPLTIYGLLSAPNFLGKRITERLFVFFKPVVSSFVLDFYLLLFKYRSFSLQARKLVLGQGRIQEKSKGVPPGHLQR